MNENETNPQLKEVDETITVNHVNRPAWKTFHHSWIFWLFLILMLAGIGYYIMTVSFMFAPQQQLQQPAETNSTR